MRYLSTTVYWLFLLSTLAGCVSIGYDQKISEVKSVPNITVQINYVGGIFWQADIKNNSATPVKLIWDESAYVNSEGYSSRLIRGKTRKLHTAQAQPTSPIPPGALLSNWFTAERFAEFSNFTGTLSPDDPSGTGRFYLSFEIEGNRYTWEGSVEFIRVEKTAIERTNEQWELVKRRHGVTTQ